MRTASGKGNDARKVLSYYSVNFNLSPPYQVLCDGPTIFQSLKNDLYLKLSLPKLLGATAYPVVTNCIVSELKSLGEDFSNAALFAKRAKRVPCAHDEERTSASDCIVFRLKQRKELKLLLATNDAKVMARLSHLVGIPSITVVNQTKLMLKPPSKATLEHVEKQQQIKGTVTNVQDRALIEKVEAEELEKLPGKYQIRQIKKRKRAKGPNPLSVKKPKTPKNTKITQNGKSSGNHIHGTSWNENVVDDLEGITAEKQVDTGEESCETGDVDDDTVHLEKRNEKSITMSGTCSGKIKRKRTRVRKRSQSQTEANPMPAKSAFRNGQNTPMDTKDIDSSLLDCSEGKKDDSSFTEDIVKHQANDTKGKATRRAELEVAKEMTLGMGKEQESGSAIPNGKLQSGESEEPGDDKLSKDSYKESLDAATRERGRQDVSVLEKQSTLLFTKPDVSGQSGDDEKAEEPGVTLENDDSAGPEVSTLKRKKQRKNRRRRPKNLKEI